MRYFVIPFGMVLAAAALASAKPAEARDYQYCLYERMGSDCDYSTYAQCQASASGRGATCNVNPAYAFKQSNAFAKQLPARALFPSSNGGSVVDAR